MRKIGFKEKIGYGLGDGASNIIWQTIMLFMAYFYTDIYGLSAFHMGTMFLVVRAFDAIADVYIGYLADHTQTRYGQFRPYLLWFSLPFGIFGALTFYGYVRGPRWQKNRILYILLYKRVSARRLP